MSNSAEATTAIETVSVNAHKQINLLDFLQSHDYAVTGNQGNVYRITRENLEVFVSIDEKNLFFETSLGSTASIASETLYRDLLDLNTEILPVSLALDTASTKEPQLIIVESRERENLDENEVLSVLEAMEIAMARVEIFLSKTLTSST